jgi:hypothetical protein
MLKYKLTAVGSDNNRLQRGHPGYNTVFNPEVLGCLVSRQVCFQKRICSSAFLDAPIFDKYVTSLRTRPPRQSGAECRREVQNYEVTGSYRIKQKYFIELAAYISGYNNLGGTETVLQYQRNIKYWNKRNSWCDGNWRMLS